MSRYLGGIIGCKDETSSWHLNGFLDGSNIGSTNKNIVVHTRIVPSHHAAIGANSLKHKERYDSLLTFPLEFLVSHPKIYYELMK